jgi:DNA-binding transcriptional regulator YiaG
MDVTALDNAIRARRAQRSLPGPRERRRIRDDAGLTRREVAQILRTAPANVASWERVGGSSPRGVLALHYELLLRALMDVEQSPASTF